jgi:hypothetical protein
MKNKFLKTLIIGIVALFGISITAQERVINGAITTFDSIPLISVKIQVKSTNQIVFSDSMGNFSAKCNNKDKLIVSAKGFYSQKVKISENTSFAAINMKLKSGSANQENAFVYLNASNIEKLKVASTSNEDFDFSTYNSIYELIPGRINGVDIVNGEFRMRGTRSISGSDAALVLVDGIPTDYQGLSLVLPINVKSITVLRGSKAAAYGGEAANGIIAIETKQGRK